LRFTCLREIHSNGNSHSIRALLSLARTEKLFSQQQKLLRAAEGKSFMALFYVIPEGALRSLLCKACVVPYNKETFTEDELMWYTKRACQMLGEVSLLGEITCDHPLIQDLFKVKHVQYRSDFYRARILQSVSPVTRFVRYNF
jgi:hypothetical protein